MSADNREVSPQGPGNPGFVPVTNLPHEELAALHDPILLNVEPGMLPEEPCNLPRRTVDRDGALESGFRQIAVGIIMVWCLTNGPSVAQTARSPEARYITTVPAPCYRYGPAQGRPPDRIVPENTEVIFLRETLEPHYIVVQLTDGMRCYILIDALSPSKTNK